MFENETVLEWIGITIPAPPIVVYGVLIVGCVLAFKPLLQALKRTTRKATRAYIMLAMFGGVSLGGLSVTRLLSGLPFL